MKKFFFRGLLYSLPLIVIILSVWLIDPYNLFWSGREFNQKKYDIGYSYDQGRRYKLFTYKNNPKERIVLGASEIKKLNESTIPEDGWHSLSFGGAPLQESIQLFWEIVKNYKVKDVILAPEFIKYYLAISQNEEQYYSKFDWKASQSATALKIYDNKSDYFIDKYTLEATWCLVKNVFSGENDRGKPTDRKQFWKHQLDYARKTFACAVDSTMEQGVKESFRKMRQYADDNNIRIRIILPIQHTDLIALEYAEPTYNVYVDYLRTLVEAFGKVYYFDYPSELSHNAEMFSDPFHYLDCDIYIQSLWGTTSYCYELNKENLEEILSTLKK